jgi:hypothetical protein
MQNQNQIGSHSVKLASPEFAVPSAAARVRMLINQLEQQTETLADRLTPVLMQVSDGGAKTQASAPHGVPLAGELYDLAARLEGLIERHSDVLDRLHV